MLMKWICNKKTAEIGKSLAAIGLALVIGALFILLAGESPIRAYTSLIQGALGTPQSIANVIFHIEYKLRQPRTLITP